MQNPLEMTLEIRATDRLALEQTLALVLEQVRGGSDACHGGGLDDFYSYSIVTMDEDLSPPIGQDEDTREQEKGKEHMIPEEIVPTVDFEYDLFYYGDDYDDVGASIQVPVSLIERLGEEGAFEETAHVNRCHIIHWEAEESEASGNEVTQSDLDEQQVRLLAEAREHLKTCGVCSAAATRGRKR